MLVNIVFYPHNIRQVWTCHQSTLQSIQSMKLYNQYVGTARYKILPIIRHCAPFCAHYFFFLRNMLFSHSFMHFCCDLLSLRFTHILPLFVAEKLLLAIVLLLLAPKASEASWGLSYFCQGVLSGYCCVYVSGYCYV